MASEDAQQPRFSSGEGPVNEDARVGFGNEAVWPPVNGAGPYAYPPAQGYETPPPSATPPPAAMHDLRPLSIGEILDRTFTLYRSRFWLFAGISSMAAVVQVISAGTQMIGFRGMLRVPLTGPTAAAQMPAVLMHSFEAVLVSYLAAFVYLLAASVTQAATAWALSEVYLGRAASVGAAMRVAGRRWWMFVGIAFWQIFSFVWLPALLGGLAVAAVASVAALKLNKALFAVPVLLFLGVFGALVFGAIRFLMNSLAIPASVAESLPVRASIRRSKVLSRGTKGRIFLLLLVVWAMYMVAGVIQAPLSLLWLRAPSESHVVAQATMLLIGFVANTLVAPVMLIGLTLVYFDQRVRQEAFDILMLMGEANPAPALVPGGGGMGDASPR